MAAAQKTRDDTALEFMKDGPFIRNACIIIKEMVELSSKDTTELVDEILHSIFFLGKIHSPSYTPEDIVSDGDMLNALRDCYPRPFKLYSSQLPRRSPFSCVLDMIVHWTRQKKEKEIIEKLQKLILQLKKDEATDLVCSTICVSQNNKIPNSVRYYGVNMSTSGRLPGRIIIAASCLSTWDSYVAGAVMTYYPKKEKKSYFDGTIKLPPYVRCQAFSFSDRKEKEMPPCKSCGNLFGLTTREKKEWPYGNCAEAESVSNLLKNEKEVREQARPTSETCTDENRKRAKESVLKELAGFLSTVQFRKWDKNFYTPQRV